MRAVARGGSALKSALSWEIPAKMWPGLAMIVRRSEYDRSSTVEQLVALLAPLPSFHTLLVHLLGHFLVPLFFFFGFPAVLDGLYPSIALSLFLVPHLLLQSFIGGLGLIALLALRKV
jgi:hypothetical protein